MAEGTKFSISPERVETCRIALRSEENTNRRLAFKDKYR